MKKSDLKVLIVDHNPNSRSHTKSVLRQTSMVSITSEMGSNNPEDIVRNVSETKPDVIIIDQDMAEQNVFGIVRDLKIAIPDTKLHFVLSCYKLDTETRRIGKSVGILGYLAKPFHTLQLESALRDAMGDVATDLKEILLRVRRIKFFADFSDNELLKLLKICHTRRFKRGEVVFNEGDVGDRFYIIVVGEVDILKVRQETMELLVTNKPGECFGEMSIVDEEPRSAQAMAKTDVALLEINAEIIKDKQSMVALKIFRQLALLVTNKLRTYTSELAARQASAE